jgi:hypothetical protein
MRQPVVILTVLAVMLLALGTISQGSGMSNLSLTSTAEKAVDSGLARLHPSS